MHAHEDSLAEQALQERASDPPEFGHDESDSDREQHLASLFARYERELPWADPWDGAPRGADGRKAAAVLAEIATLRIALAALDTL